MNDELKNMTAGELEKLLEQKRAEERQAADKRRRDYEETRAFCSAARSSVRSAMVSPVTCMVEADHG